MSIKTVRSIGERPPYDAKGGPSSKDQHAFGERYRKMNEQVAAYYRAHSAHVSNSASEDGPVSRADIDRLIYRGKALRAKSLRAWGQRALASWTALFNQHNHVLPRHSSFRAGH